MDAKFFKEYQALDAELREKKNKFEQVERDHEIYKRGLELVQQLLARRFSCSGTYATALEVSDKFTFEAVEKVAAEVLGRMGYSLSFLKEQRSYLLECKEQ